MHSTEIRIGEGALVTEMTRMRVWLDSRHFEPAVFRHEHDRRGVVVRVDFAVETEAAAFAAEFGGQLVR